MSDQPPSAEPAKAPRVRRHISAPRGALPWLTAFGVFAIAVVSPSLNALAANMASALFGAALMAIRNHDGTT